MVSPISAPVSGGTIVVSTNGVLSLTLETSAAHNQAGFFKPGDLGLIFAGLVLLFFGRKERSEAGWRSPIASGSRRWRRKLIKTPMDHDIHLTCLCRHFWQVWISLFSLMICFIMRVSFATKRFMA